MIPVRLVMAGGIAALLALGAWHINDSAYDRGYAAHEAEIAAETQRRLNDANLADDASRRCAADPACRLSNDGFRRD